MLVLPIQHRVNWKHPPLLCLLLIAANTLIYALFSTADADGWDGMLMRYRQADILRHEWPVYVDYRQQTTHPLTAVDTLAEDSSKAFMIILDKRFDAYLDTYWNNHSQDNNSQWQQARRDVQRLRDQQSAIRFGVTPTEHKPLTFVTSIFMHGGVDHLLGNMIFLFLFGFAMESLLGKFRFLLIYLASGICAAVFFCLFNKDSQVPLVGASGAIAGLMGMYIAAYGIKKIRFFYYLFFWFGEFTAPALMVLPVWIGKELWEEFTSESNVAYLAHVGGIASGYILSFVAIKIRQPVVDSHYAVEEKEDTEDVFNRKMARVSHYVAKLDIDNAKKSCRNLLQEYPDRFEVWEKSYDIVKPNKRSQEYHELVLNIFRQASKACFPKQFLVKVFEDYRQPGGSYPALGGVICALLARRFMDEGLMAEADYLLRRAVEVGYRHTQMQLLLERMLTHFQRNKQSGAIAFYGEQLQQLAAKS